MQEDVTGNQSDLCATDSWFCKPDVRQALASPTVEIFAIGTELVTGHIHDTNSFWIAQRITELGGRVLRITVLPDDQEVIVGNFADCVSRGTSVLISTGGLGPTPDDVTIASVATLLGTTIYVHEPTLQEYMRRRNLTSRNQLTPNLIAMATVPCNTEVLQNPIGWAPCIRARQGGTTLFILPGPPKEVEGIFALHIAGYVGENCCTKSVSQRVRVNMFESEVSPLMQAVMERFPGSYLKAYVALRPSLEHDLPVEIVATGSDTAAATRILEDVLQYFRTLVMQKGKKMECAEG